MSTRSEGQHRPDRGVNQYRPISTNPSLIWIGYSRLSTRRAPQGKLSSEGRTLVGVLARRGSSQQKVRPAPPSLSPAPGSAPRRG